MPSNKFSSIYIYIIYTSSIFHLFKHFLKQIILKIRSAYPAQSGEGYQPQEISILAMYDGQVSLLRRLLKSEALEEVQCSSVDRYQGVKNG